MTAGQGDETVDKENRRGGFSVRKMLPILIIAVVAAVGFVALRDFFNFESLRENRDALIEFRDANYFLTSVSFVFAYVAIVAFSLAWRGDSIIDGRISVQPFSRFSLQYRRGDDRRIRDLFGG